MSGMTDLSKGNRGVHPEMKRVRYYLQDEIYPPVFQHYPHHLSYDIPRGGSYSAAPYHHRTRSYPVQLSSSDDTKVRAPENHHSRNHGSLTPVQMRDDTTSGSLSSEIDPKPQDVMIQHISDNAGDVSREATQLILTAASALTSFTKPSTFSASSSRDDVSPSVERQQTTDAVTKDIVKKKSGREKAIKFPVKLMNILSCEEYQDIISWMPDGKGFMVQKPKAFVSHILPLHFKEVKFSSFTRKLHRWGFTKMLRGKGNECGAYCHKDFQRGRMDLCIQMRCCDRDGLKALPSEDISLSSSEAHVPQSSDRLRQEKEYENQQARRDYSYYDNQDMRSYAHPMSMPIPQLPDTYHATYPTTYRPLSGGVSNYYDWNSWSSTSNNHPGPSWDYERVTRNPWQYPARDQPAHNATHRKMHPQTTHQHSPSKTF